jgi:hypothetical protein
MALVLSGSIDISGSMTATTIIISAPGSSGIVSSSQQIQNYNLFAQTSSANTFYGNQTITGSVRITNGLIIGASGSFASLGSYPNALTVNGNTTGTFGGAIFLARGSATQWGIISNDSDDLSITNNDSFSTRNIKIYDSAEKIEFTYSGSLADNSAGYHNIAFTGNAIVPYQTNHYDLGSETNYFRDLYISTGSIKFVNNGTVVSTLSTNADGSQNFPNGLTISGSIKVGNYGNIKDTFDHIHLYTSGANFNGGGNIQFGAIEGSAASGVDNYISFNGSPTTAASNTSVTIWGDNSGGGAALFLNRKSSQGVESWGYTPWTIGVDLGATSTPNGLYIGTGNTFLNRSIEFNYKGLTPNILFSGSGIIPAQANTYDLGTPTKPWREIYVSTGSINFVNNGVVVSTLGADANGTQLSGSLTVSGSSLFTTKLKIGPDIGAGINSSFENALEIGSNPDVGLGGAMFFGNTLGSSTWGMLSNGSNNFAIANQSGFQSRAITLYNTENKIEFLYSGSINAYGSGFHNIRFDENGIIPYSSNKYDLGSATNTWKNLYIASGSINFVNNGTVVSTISTNADGSQNFTNGINVTGSLRVTGSLKVGDWSWGDGVANNAKLDIRTASDRGLKIDGATSSDIIITSYRGSSDDMVRGMVLQGNAVSFYIGDGNANTGSSVASFNTNGLGFESGKGIDFSATSNGSGTTTSELLNDYEEGTWTPTYTGTNLTVVSYGNQFGWYTKVGRLVTVTICLMTEDITRIGSEILKIGGLPFTSNSTAQATNALVIGDSSRWDTNPPKYGVILPNVTEIVLYRDSGATGAGTDPVTVKTDDLADATGNRNVMRATLTYFV